MPTHTRPKRRSRSKRDRKTLAMTPMIGGRYSGKPLCRVPLGYLHWIMEDRTFDQATRWLVRRYLKSLPNGQPTPRSKT
jgi:uncharacterized protein (DUF3820 family)